MGGVDPAPPGSNDDDALLLLNGDAELHVGSDGPVDEEAFLAEVPDIIPACVAGIHEFWRHYRKPRMAEVEAGQKAADAGDRTRQGANCHLAIASWEC